MAALNSVLRDAVPAPVRGGVAPLRFDRLKGGKQGGTCSGVM